MSGRWRIPWELLPIALVAAGLRFWALGQAALIGDESYYWLWSEKLAPSYFDHPAGVALLVRLSTWVGGPSEGGIRWLNAGLGVGAVVLVYALGARLYSRHVGAVAALLVAVGAPYVLTGRFVYTDALHLFLLLLNLWFLVPFLVEEPPRYRNSQFWAAGLSTAALLNTKYGAYLYALAVVALVLFGRRRLLADRRTWLAVGLGLAGLLPTLLWNAVHGWASFRWQFQHLAGGGLGQASLLGRLAHVADYLSPPLVLLVLLGMTRLRGARERLLWLPGLALVVPVLLSPADSPRNLSSGAVLLLTLGVEGILSFAATVEGPAVPARGPSSGEARPRTVLRTVAWAGLAVLLLTAGLWGVGTLRETLAPTAWPHSAAATDVRRDGLGWRQAGQLLPLDPRVTVFAVDYSIASQLRYYTGLPVQTSWGQYRLWGTPDVRAVQVVALTYVRPAAITEWLQQDCAQVSGPTAYALGEGKVLRLWRAGGCGVAAETFLQHLDLLNLLRAGGAP